MGGSANYDRPTHGEGDCVFADSSFQVVNVDDDTAKDTKISQLEEEVSKLTDQVQQAKNKNEVIFRNYQFGGGLPFYDFSLIFDNQELRERNWKVMDAVASAENLARAKTRELEVIPDLSLHS